MSVAGRSKAAVEERLAELEEDHSGFAIHQTTWEASSDRYTRAVERFEDGDIVGVAVRVTDPSGEVLLIREDDGWVDPAGRVYPGEALDDAAIRIVYEETSIECALTDVRRARIVGVIDGERDEVDPVYQLAVRFDGRHVGGTPSLNGTLQWHEEPPDDEAVINQAMRAIG